MKTLLFAVLVALAFGLNACHAITYTLSGLMDPLQAGTNGVNEPGGGFGTFDMSITGAGDGTGTISGDYDDVTKVLNYTITWQDLTSSVTNMHFHNAPVGSSGGVDLGIPGPWSSPYVATAVPVNASQESNLLAGNWYVNIHTGSFGGGEIRGQVLATPVPEPATAGLAIAAFLSMVSLTRRKR